ncbi:MAG: S8 family serine peptidase [Verrucomicrobiales bacterium]|nr:S8 family serine peptidase [Verrucomicrobiales bacterium]
MWKLVSSLGQEYCPAVNRSRRSIPLFWACFVICAGLKFSTWAAGTKTIRLRNETITTSAAANPALSPHEQTAGAIASGLYLVQFTGPFDQSWPEQLQRLNVTLLRSVPEDAFVAWMQEGRLARIQALPFVHWVGEYRASYKLHRRLQPPEEGEELNLPPVRVLLAPKLQALELLQARRALRSVSRESRSRFGIVLEGQATSRQLTVLAESPAVLWIEPAPAMKLLDEVSAKIVAGGAVNTGRDSAAGQDDFSGIGPASLRPNAPEPDAAPVHATLTQQLGFDGRGVTVAVADSGLNNGDRESMHPDLKGRVDALFFYGKLADAADQHSHGTHVAGIIAGDGVTGETDDFGALYGLGLAPQAHIVAQRIFDGVGSYEAPPTFETLTRDAVRAGALIGSNSWGDDTQGRYDISAAEFDALVRDADINAPGDQPYILAFSAGNAGPGPQTIASPAVAKNVIASGASQNNRFDFVTYAEGQEAMSDFSSRGPCEDGRIKPDVVAPGTWIASLQSESATDGNAWSPISPQYQYQGGTSQSGPHVSGAAAVFVQYYRETHAGAVPSPALVKAALINSAVDLDDEIGGTGPIPNMEEGWGRLDLTQMIGSSRRYDFLDQTQLLATSQTYEHRVVAASSEEPLKITLTYTDVPGLPSAIPALVNDLDLEVISPEGTVYHGNQFDHGESVGGAPGYDGINNVEGVHLFFPVPGEYLVRIRARRVAEDARRDTAAVDQDFALVLSGDIPEPGQAVVILDRPAYRAPGQIQLKLIDLKLAGQPSAPVRLTSSTEKNGETVTLQAFGMAGVFTGAVATVTGPAAVDGKLQVAHDDQIEATYAEGAQLRQAAARADLVPPTIANVTSTNRYGRALIGWTTDEPANANVFFGTNSVLSFSATNSAFRTEHEIALDNLVPGYTYQFVVMSTDVAGNSTTNSNGARPFTITAAAAKTVLLVNAYTPDDPLFGLQNIPVTEYTGALDRTGASYELWNVAERGSPEANDLRPFRVVMWRLNDSIGSVDTLSPQQQGLLQTYVAGGGSLFISSMELLSRLGDNSAFRANTLHVESFETDAGIPLAEGVASDPITSGMQIELDYSLFYSDLLEFLGQKPDLADPLNITTNAAPIFFDSLGKVAGLRFPRTGEDSAGRVVFLPFPLEAVPRDAPPRINRVTLLRNILGFLAPGSFRAGTVALDNSEYTIPSLVTVEVGDSDLTGHPGPTVWLFSDTETNGVPITVTETVRRGLFRGFITLVAKTNAPAAGQLRVKHGDILRAEYLDVSGNSLISATAVLDTEIPTIQAVEAVPAYEEATISWNTSKLADSLVQFGESPLLSRTAYQGQLADTHQVTLVGLVPDRIYYFKVVSRDAAGNTGVADNSTKLFTFHTLKPFRVPLLENFDGPTRTNWTALSGGMGSEAIWQLGVPRNGRASNALSRPNVWGSNLEGKVVGFADTDLISPAVELSGGNNATLRFWHSFDFTKRSEFLDTELGTILVSTNNGVAWSILREWGDLTPGWDKEEIDLSPYLGHVVRLRWNYYLFSVAALPRPGWLLDDVSITVTNIVRGTIQVSNNIAQASFTLSGPLTQAGQGATFTLRSAPVGQYTIAFDDVPYYFKPPPQTNTLGANTTLVFQGVYSFSDANRNGISDLWEQHYFAEVSPLRTGAMDSDRDGLSDYAEFIAGTDPTQRISLLAVSSILPLPNGTVRLGWIATPGHLYRVLGSTDAITWAPLSNWLRPANTNASFVVPPLHRSVPYFFQLEVKP